MSQLPFRDQVLRDFHAANPGVTERAFGRAAPGTADSYSHLAAAVSKQTRILDVGCGSGRMIRLLGEHRTVGLDPSAAELALAPRTAALVQGRAAALPFADRSFDGVTAHLVLDVIGDAEYVVRELVRVNRRDGIIAVVVGGGPTFDGNDALSAYAELAPRMPHQLGTPLVRDEKVWKKWLPTSTFTRFTVDLSGPFEEAWPTLASGYELHGQPERAAQIRDQLRARFGAHLPITAVFFLVTARI